MRNLPRVERAEITVIPAQTCPLPTSDTGPQLPSADDKVLEEGGG